MARLKIKFWFLHLVWVLGLAGCSTDFEVNAPPREVSLIYCLLDKNAPFQTARITRLFQNRNQDARQIAKNNPDSANYDPADLEVFLYGIRNNDTLQRLQLYDTLYSIKDLDGEFYAPNQLIFKTPNFQINPNLQYVIYMRNKKTGYQTQASTPIVADMNMLAPNPNSNIRFRTVEVDPRFTDVKTAVTVTGDNRTAIGFADYVMYFDEYYMDGTVKPDSVTWENFVTFDVTQEATTGRFRLSGNYFDDSFITIIGTKLKNRGINPALTERRIKYLKIKVTTGSPSVQEYIYVSGSFSSITQAKPVYSNFTNGLGVFGSVLRESFQFNTAIGGTIGTDMIFRKRYPELKF